MIILKAVHEARLSAKDAEIVQLKNEIAWLRNFIQPARKAVTHSTGIEADLILGGHQETVEIEPSAPQLTPEERAVLSERDRLLSGTY